jgi:signal transduction histidine kinase
MRLQTRFRIVTGASLAALLLLALGMAWTIHADAEATEDLTLAQAIMRVQYDRALLRDEFLLFGGGRPLKQWTERTASLSALLDMASGRLQQPEERELVAEMKDHLARTTTLLNGIARRDVEAGTPGLRGDQSDELRRRSVVRLRVVAHDLYARARQLAAVAEARSRAAQSRSTVAMVVAFAAVFAVTFLNGRTALLTLQRRLSRLSAGAERIAGGDLDHQLAISGDDELAELGATFDRMTRRLQATYAALELSNRELEAFSYAVSHDLRAPLRSVSGFSHAVLEDYGPQLDATGRQYLEMADEAAREMGQLIDDLLSLSRVSRAEMDRQQVDLSAMARSIIDDLRRADPERRVEVEIADGLAASGDPTLLRLALENLLRNAWKFTSSHRTGRITFDRVLLDGRVTFRVADDGAGFDMAYVEKLFNPFQRLHRTSEFPGTGIGLATVSRVVRRHGGVAWATGALEQGATIYFTLPDKEGAHAEQGHPAGRGQPEGRPAHRAGLQAEQDRQRPAPGA